MVEKLFSAIILSCFLAGTGWAETPSPSVIATPPQPQWRELTVQQKSVLAPLSGDWDAMEYYRQKKWLGIVRRFPAMAPEEQRRVQAQMQEWGKLTPEQRKLAREKFQTANLLPSEKKQQLKQKWEEYSSLPDEEKEKLKQQAASKPVPKPGRPVANVQPSPPGITMQNTPPPNSQSVPAPASPTSDSTQTTVGGSIVVAPEHAPKP